VNKKIFVPERLNLNVFWLKHWDIPNYYKSIPINIFIFFFWEEGLPHSRPPTIQAVNIILIYSIVYNYKSKTEKQIIICGSNDVGLVYIGISYYYFSCSEVLSSYTRETRAKKYSIFIQHNHTHKYMCLSSICFCSGYIGTKNTYDQKLVFKRWKRP